MDVAIWRFLLLLIGGMTTKADNTSHLDLDAAVARADMICPCTTYKLCPNYYGSSPYDIANYGALPPCATYGRIRCCTSKTGYGTTTSDGLSVFRFTENSGDSNNSSSSEVKDILLPRGDQRNPFVRDGASSTKQDIKGNNLSRIILKGSELEQHDMNEADIGTSVQTHTIGNNSHQNDSNANVMAFDNQRKDGGLDTSNQFYLENDSNSTGIFKAKLNEQGKEFQREFQEIVTPDFSADFNDFYKTTLVTPVIYQPNKPKQYDQIDDHSTKGNIQSTIYGRNPFLTDTIGDASNPIKQLNSHQNPAIEYSESDVKSQGYGNLTFGNREKNSHSTAMFLFSNNSRNTLISEFDDKGLAVNSGFAGDATSVNHGTEHKIHVTSKFNKQIGSEFYSNSDVDLQVRHSLRGGAIENHIVSLHPLNAVDTRHVTLKFGEKLIANDTKANENIPLMQSVNTPKNDLHHDKSYINTNNYRNHVTFSSPPVHLDNFQHVSESSSNFDSLRNSNETQEIVEINVDPSHDASEYLNYSTSSTQTFSTSADLKIPPVLNSHGPPVFAFHKQEMSPPTNAVSKILYTIPETSKLRTNSTQLDKSTSYDLFVQILPEFNFSSSPNNFHQANLSMSNLDNYSDKYPSLTGHDDMQHMTKHENFTAIPFAENYYLNESLLSSQEMLTSSTTDVTQTTGVFGTLQSNDSFPLLASRSTNPTFSFPVALQLAKSSQPLSQSYLPAAESTGKSLLFSTSQDNFNSDHVSQQADIQMSTIPNIHITDFQHHSVEEENLQHQSFIQQPESDITPTYRVENTAVLNFLSTVKPLRLADEAFDLNNPFNQPSCRRISECIRKYGNHPLDACVYGFLPFCRSGHVRCLDNYFGPVDRTCITQLFSLHSKSPNNRQHLTEDFVQTLQDMFPGFSNTVDEIPRTLFESPESENIPALSKSMEVEQRKNGSIEVVTINLRCTLISMCQHRYGPEDVVNYGYLSECPKGLVRCLDSAPTPDRKES